MAAENEGLSRPKRSELVLKGMENRRPSWGGVLALDQLSGHAE